MAYSYEGGSVAEWLACWTQAQEGLGSNRSRYGPSRLHVDDDDDDDPCRGRQTGRRTDGRTTYRYIDRVRHRMREGGQCQYVPEECGWSEM